MALIRRRANMKAVTVSNLRNWLTNKRRNLHRQSTKMRLPRPLQGQAKAKSLHLDHEDVVHTLVDALSKPKISLHAAILRAAPRLTVPIFTQTMVDEAVGKRRTDFII